MPTIPNHLDVVEAARARYAGLAGPERAHRIVNAVAWELRDEGAGLFLKTGGTRFLDRALDIVMFKTGETFDVLRDAEGKAEPAWSRTKPTGMGDPKKWRAPVNPEEAVADGGSPNTSPAVTGPSDPSLSDPGVSNLSSSTSNAEVVAEMKAIRNALDALIARLQQ